MSRKIVSISEIPKSLTSNKGYEKEPTYDELINEIHTSKDKIQLPNRMMRRLRDSPQLMFYDDINAGELEEQHRNITANQMRDAELRRIYSQSIPPTGRNLFAPRPATTGVAESGESENEDIDVEMEGVYNSIDEYQNALEQSRRKRMKTAAGQARAALPGLPSVFETVATSSSVGEAAGSLAAQMAFNWGSQRLRSWATETTAQPLTPMSATESHGSWGSETLTRAQSDPTATYTPVPNVKSKVMAKERILEIQKRKREQEGGKNKKYTMEIDEEDLTNPDFVPGAASASRTEYYSMDEGDEEPKTSTRKKISGKTKPEAATPGVMGRDRVLETQKRQKEIHGTADPAIVMPMDSAAAASAASSRAPKRRQNKDLAAPSTAGFGYLREIFEEYHNNNLITESVYEEWEELFKTRMKKGDRKLNEEQKKLNLKQMQALYKKEIRTVHFEDI